jgi:outer membrane protein assembly factor BamB
MTHDGKYIFYSTISRIYQVNPSTGTIVRSFPAPGGKCRSLTSDGGNLLFGGDASKNEIIVFEKNSLHVVCRFKAPGRGGSRVEGLAYDRVRKILYIANQSENMIYYGTLH